MLLIMPVFKFTLHNYLRALKTLSGDCLKKEIVCAANMTMQSEFIGNKRAISCAFFPYFQFLR